MQNNFEHTLYSLPQFVAVQDLLLDFSWIKRFAVFKKGNTQRNST